VLDWFHMIASSSDGYCDPVYSSGNEGPGGDHPSNAAVAVIDPQFVQQIYDAAIAYENGPLAVTWAGPPSLTGNLMNRVQVGWQTLSEINTYRFYAQKTQGQLYELIDSVNAVGTSLSRRLYAVTDSNVTAGRWIYRIKEVDLNGVTHYSETASMTVLAIAPAAVVTAYALEQNYPNPFNPATQIRYALRQRAVVSLEVFNTLGQIVATLVNETEETGVHEVRFDATNLASGLYFYRLRAHPEAGLAPAAGAAGQPGDFVQTKELLLLK
jgi:hypothetical protein